jgi:ribosomal protein S18 acetylase RimI-like enzyme
MTNSSSDSSVTLSPAEPSWAAATIRRLEAGDRQPLERILQAVGVFTPEEIRVALELIDEAIAKPEGDYRALGIVAANGIIGYTCYGRAPFTEFAYDLYWIAVDPAAQGSGAARRLMAATEESVASLGGKLLLVETASKPSYARTRRFYEALHYREVARIRDYYAAGDDKIVSEKRWT